MMRQPLEILKSRSLRPIAAVVFVLGCVVLILLLVAPDTFSTHPSKSASSKVGSEPIPSCYHTTTRIFEGTGKARMSASYLQLLLPRKGSMAKKCSTVWRVASGHIESISGSGRDCLAAAQSLILIRTASMNSGSCVLRPLPPCVCHVRQLGLRDGGSI